MTGCRVFTVAFAEKKVIKLPTWDKQMLPLPFSPRRADVPEWTDEVPKKPSGAEAEALRQSLEQSLDAITDAAGRSRRAQRLKQKTPPRPGPAVFLREIRP